MKRQVTCVYHAYDGDELIATGRLTLDGIPSVGEELALNGRSLVVRSVVHQGGEPLLTLAAR